MKMFLLLVSERRTFSLIHINNVDPLYPLYIIRLSSCYRLIDGSSSREPRERCFYARTSVD